MRAEHLDGSGRATKDPERSRRTKRGSGEAAKGQDGGADVYKRRHGRGRPQSLSGGSEG